MLPQLCFTPQHCQLWGTPWQSRLWFGKIWLRVPTWANFLRVTWLKTDGPWWDLKRILCEVSLMNRTSMHNYYQTPPDQSLLFTSNVFHISLKNMTLVWLTHIVKDSPLPNRQVDGNHLHREVFQKCWQIWIWLLVFACLGSGQGQEHATKSDILYYWTPLYHKSYCNYPSISYMGNA